MRIAALFLALPFALSAQAPPPPPTAELIKLNPLQGHLAVARVARRQKDAAAEELAYKAALAAAPDSTQPYYGLAAFYRRKSRWDDAFATCDRLLHMKPDDATAHVVWGITAAQSGKNLERGERELKYYLEKPPKEARPQDFSRSEER